MIDKLAEPCRFWWGPFDGATLHVPLRNGDDWGDIRIGCDRRIAVYARSGPSDSGFFFAGYEFPFPTLTAKQLVTARWSWTHAEDSGLDTVAGFYSIAPRRFKREIK